MLNPGFSFNVFRKDIPVWEKGISQKTDSSCLQEVNNSNTKIKITKPLLVTVKFLYIYKLPCFKTYFGELPVFLNIQVLYLFLHYRFQYDEYEVWQE